MLACWLWIGQVCLAIGLESGLGLVVVDEMDDRQRPGVMVQLGIGHFETRLYYYERSFGPVAESTGLLSLSSQFRVPLYFASMTAVTGLAILQEKTVISYAPEDALFNAADSRTNVGPFLGLHTTHVLAGSWYGQFGWDAAIFPAGLAGGLFLATGRKQFLSLATGYRW